jgi:hypothetical protein
MSNYSKEGVGCSLVGLHYKDQPVSHRIVPTAVIFDEWHPALRAAGRTMMSTPLPPWRRRIGFDDAMMPGEHASIAGVGPAPDKRCPTLLASLDVLPSALKPKSETFVSFSRFARDLSSRSGVGGYSSTTWFE